MTALVGERTPTLPSSPSVRRLTGPERVWRSLDEPITGRRVPGSVPVGMAAGVISLVVSLFIARTGFNLAYSDAQSHLTIARRLLDTKSNPGLAQLGTVWLPVPHLLLAPLAMSLWLWHTGLAAALLGAGCMAVTAAGLYRAAARWGARRIGRLAVVGVIVANPTLLYLSSTALTEPVLIASMAACLAGLANVATRRRLSSPGEIAVFCGIPAALAVLCRYEGWALLLTGAAFVVLVSARRAAGRARSLVWRSVFTHTLGFAVPPLLAMGWWIGFNWVVFHRPLAFLNGEYSANAQQAGIVAAGASTRSSLRATLAALDAAVSSSVGPASLALAAIGLIVVCLSARRRRQLPFLVTAATSYLFLVLALYTGQAIIWNKAIGSSYIWNNRFGMASILPVALLAAPASEALPALARRWAPAARRSQLAAVLSAALVAATIGLQCAWFLQRPLERSLVLTEAQESWVSNAPSREAATWLRKHYSGGGILMDETISANAQLPQIGIPLREFYLKADGSQFDEAVRNPMAHAQWIWLSSDRADALEPVMSEPAVRSHYRIAASNGDVTIFVRTDS
ncbi:hypothetical protein SAMN05443377_13114 [Propionibacterium cyclohexanicum]|uniref:Glycosyltransferase RgtA/B/C/D-like domain-containing protein n=1 Tax=Propionibacterium cyclohexanicum TaxID=64702 RepID=A0A1H9TXX0_9ACTN|nr:hypothetical protein [Propionibacterium cyclohexanicum]SES01969.1 hypothetical protein SAMN05443377_13114 [Propionibacterium cyclohexanicum]